VSAARDSLAIRTQRTSELDELVGHAVVTTRWHQHQDQALLRTAYVDAVATSPAHQGWGWEAT
jgi:hypothetical protein